MLGVYVVDVPAMAFCSGFSLLGCSTAASTPSISAMMVALEVVVGRRCDGGEWWDGMRGEMLM